MEDGALSTEVEFAKEESVQGGVSCELVSRCGGTFLGIAAWPEFLECLCKEGEDHGEEDGEDKSLGSLECEEEEPCE